MRARFFNSSNKDLQTVARIALPQTKFNKEGKYSLLSLGEEQLYNSLIYEKSVGDMTHIFTVSDKFKPGLTEFEIVDDVEGIWGAPGFHLTEWAAKDPARTLIRAKIVHMDDTVTNLWIGNSINHIRATNHVQTFHIPSNVIKGWRQVQWLSAFSNMDHVEFKYALNWADNTNPSYNTRVKKIVLECNDNFVVAFGSQFNLGTRYDPMNDIWSMTIIDNPEGQDFKDGQGFELRGYILTNPENMIPGVEIEDVDHDNIDARLRNLEAVKYGMYPFGGIGQVVGMIDRMPNEMWFNRYLPTLDDIKFKTPTYYANISWTPNLFSQRYEGVSRFPGQSGAQADFGSDKGFEATLFGTPMWILYYQGALVDRFRTYNIHEQDGSKVTKENHPNRITWGQITFHQLSQDLLGKDRYSYPTVGIDWHGYDTQHMSQNGQTVYLALTGDELEYDTMENAIEANMQQAKNLMLADREVGRTFACWARHHRLLPQSKKPRLFAFIEKKIREFLSYWRGRLLIEDPFRPVRVSEVIIDERSNIRNPVTGRIEPSWICYQHAQMISGMYAMLQELKVYGSELYAEFYETLMHLCHTYLWHGVFKQDGNWIPVIFARYRTGLESGVRPESSTPAPEEGLPLDPSSYNTSSWEISLDLGNGGWWNWVGPAISVAYKMLNDYESRNRAKEILNQKFPEGFNNIETAEWWPLPLIPDSEI